MPSLLRLYAEIIVLTGHLFCFLLLKKGNLAQHVDQREITFAETYVFNRILTVVSELKHSVNYIYPLCLSLFCSAAWCWDPGRMLELNVCSEQDVCSGSSRTLSERSARMVPGSGSGGCSPVPGFLLQDPEGWCKHRGALLDGSLLEPYDPAGALLTHTSAPSLHTLCVPCAPSSLDLGEAELPVSPNVIKRRRGGLIEQRDIIKAHQAHKIHSTPQARRKEWEWVHTKAPYYNCTHVEVCTVFLGLTLFCDWFFLFPKIWTMLN